MRVTKLSVAACTFFTLCLAGQGKSTLVDGKKNPELIPDTEAYKMMFLTLSDIQGGLSKGARLGYIGESGLNAAEVEIVMEASNQFAIYANSARRKYTSLKAQRKAGSISQAELAVQIRIAYETAEGQLKEVISKLEAELGVDASAKLLDFVRTKVKRTMTYADSSK